MIHSLRKNIHQACTALVALLMCFFLTAGSCSDPDNRPEISSVYTEKHDIPLDPVFLRYDLTSFVYDCQRYRNMYPANDIQELSSYNNVMVGSSWLDFYTLFSKADDYSGQGPEVSFIFSHLDCRGQINLRYSHFDDALCNHNIIRDAPKISSTHLVEFYAHTLITSENGISIKWADRYQATGYGTYIVIDKGGKVDYPSGFLSSGTRGGDAAGRVKDKDVCLLPNTIRKDLTSGTYEVVISDAQPIVSSILEKPIIIKGELCENVKWDVPVIVELR